MNRLQKKCVIATVGLHLLLLAVLLVGPGFYNREPKRSETHLLDMISPNVIDAALNSGVKDAVPPKPTPQVVQPPPQPVQSPSPIPQVQTPPPTRKPVEPKPTLTDRLKDLFTPAPKPEAVKPVPEKPKPTRREIQPNLTPVIRAAPKTQTPNTRPDNTRAVNDALKNLRQKLSPGTVVDIPGASSVAYSSYRDALATIYYNAWVAPEGVSNDEADTLVKIVVAADGAVVSSRIVTPSGNSKIDDSVRRALNRVSSVPPLPDKSKSEQEFTLNFNLKTKQSLE